MAAVGMLWAARQVLNAVTQALVFKGAEWQAKACTSDIYAGKRKKWH